LWHTGVLHCGFAHHDEVVSVSYDLPYHFDERFAHGYGHLDIRSVPGVLEHASETFLALYHHGGLDIDHATLYVDRPPPSGKWHDDV
jgi:hypothetical protein